MKQIDEKLGIGELLIPDDNELPALIEEDKPIDAGDEVEFETDFDKSLEILEETLDTARNSLEHIVEIAKQDESPKAFDSVTNLLRTMNQTAKLMLEMHEKRQKFKHNNIKISKEKPTDNKEVNNYSQTNNQVNIYAGTTKELEAIAENIPEIQALKEQHQKNRENDK
ncbi:terminase small subunit [Ochrobactrum phage vB_OspM_OC]|nr:terminase small subunit [Ochrobactrum phage vB_OspM_OC]